MNNTNSIPPDLQTSIPRILVTGAKGMLGQDLCPILEDSGYEVIETDVDTLDITDFECAKKVLTEQKPDIVVHCAAYTNVDKAEEDIETARLINSKGTENLAKICAELDITLVYISTDYVFDGTKNEPYKPDDTPNPINNYGLTKLEGELAVQEYCKKYYITRTSWLYGHHGKNFVETMISLADRAELKVVDDQTGCPTWTCELANGIVKLLDGKPYGIYHVCGSGFTTWYGFAKEIFKIYLSLRGGEADVAIPLTPCTTSEFPRPAKRPTYSVMDNDGICRKWQSALKDYLTLRD